MSDHISVTFDDHGDEERIQKFALFMSDLRPFWPLVVPLFIGWMRRQFETEGGFGGQPWAALSDATVQRKAQLGLRPDILQASGQLRMAASRPTRHATPTSLMLTIDDAGPEHGNVLQFHQEGEEHNPRLPIRNLIFGEPLPEEARAELQQAAEVYVNDLFNRL